MTNHFSFLLVESEPEDESLTLWVLNKYRIWNEVVLTHSAEEALEYLHGSGRYKNRDARDKPQFIVASQHLPKMSGIDLALQLRANSATKNIPLLLLINNPEEESPIRRQNIPQVLCLLKPFGFFKMLEALQKLGLYWIVMSEPSMV